MTLVKHMALTNSVFSMPVMAVAAVVVWRLSLDVMYAFLISPAWSYTGLVCEFDIARYLAVVLIQLCSLGFLNRMMSRGRLSDVGVALLYLMGFMPGLSVIAFVPTSIGFIACYFAFWLLLFVLNEKMPHFVKIEQSVTCRTGSKSHSQLVVGVLTVVGILIVLYVSYRYTGFRISLDLFDVYGLRSEASEFDKGVFVTYAFGACRSLVPALTAWFLVQGRWGVAAVLTFVAMLMFSVDGMKASLFAIFAVYAVYFLMSNRDLKRYVFAFALLGLFCLMMGFVFHSTTVVDNILRRNFYLPTFLGYGYFDFFSTHELDFYRQGFLGKIGFVSPYSDPLAVIVGEQYYIGGNANSGLLADAFANMGLAGLIVVPLAVVLIFRLFEACSAGVSSVVTDSCAIIIAYRMMNSFLPTILLTHGVLLLTLCLYFVPRSHSDCRKERLIGYGQRRCASEHPCSY